MGNAVGNLFKKAKVLKPREHLINFGYRFAQDGEIVDLRGNPFNFRLTDDMLYCVEYRYMQFLEVLSDDIFDLLENDACLSRVSIPIDASEDEPVACFFATPDYKKADKIMVLIQSMDPNLAGQWDQQLILCKGLAYGSQLPFIYRAHKNDYGVIVMNTHFNVNREKKKKPIPIRGSENPLQHLRYVYQNFLANCKAKQIDIIVHSSGWEPTAHWLAEFQSARKRVRKIVFINVTEPVQIQQNENGAKEFNEWIIKHSLNWIPSYEPLGYPVRSSTTNVTSLSAATMRKSETLSSAYFNIWGFFMSSLHVGPYLDDCQAIIASTMRQAILEEEDD
ncbi:cotranscriptional regulator ARB2A homolog [Oscarella lobularis]|uniref:cotranscriptional regulator ARB2A homolog n=1 Tax=Oscarella lobularis TaxID=121494 RepID=UPI0033144D99